jgi:4-hydroxy-2-oxoheptanedioate aldolase
VIAEAGCVPLARVPKGNHDYIKRVLDAGAWGIVVPMVDTVEQAKIAIAAAKYPPVGNRSLGGGMHSLNFDGTSAEYFARAKAKLHQTVAKGTTNSAAQERVVAVTMNPPGASS